MDKKYTTSEFTLSDEIIAEAGIKKGRRYTLKARDESSELKKIFIEFI